MFRWNKQKSVYCHISSSLFTISSEILKVQTSQRHASGHRPLHTDFLARCGGLGCNDLCCIFVESNIEVLGLVSYKCIGMSDDVERRS